MEKTRSEEELIADDPRAAQRERCVVHWEGAMREGIRASMVTPTKPTSEHRVVAAVHDVVAPTAVSRADGVVRHVVLCKEACWPTAAAAASGRIDTAQDQVPPFELATAPTPYPASNFETQGMLGIGRRHTGTHP